MIYLGGYGLIRTIIEGLRTDQLRIANTSIAISQVLALVTFLASMIVIIIRSIKGNNEKKKYAK